MKTFFTLAVALVWLSVAPAQAILNDAQLEWAAAEYLNYHYPDFNLAGTRVYSQRQTRVLRVDIRAGQRLTNDQIGTLFSALATVSRFAAKPPQELLALAHRDSAGVPIVYQAAAECTAACFLTRKITPTDWLNSCLVTRLDPG